MQRNRSLKRAGYVWLVAIAGVLVGGLIGEAWAQLASTPWPMRGHDLQHTGRSPLLGAQEPDRQWLQPLGALRSDPMTLPPF